MTPEHRERWELEIRRQREPLRKPCDLLRRAASSEDFVDSAVLGGVSVADILAGKVAESQIPSNVLDAFHAQYPQYGASFVEAVKHLAGDPERLMGLVNGVKGKLFELDYVNWLNHGHLPAGMTAELAHHANNPGWDIAIHDAHGHIDQLLQLKATDSVSYVHEAIAAHPDIDAVVPHELYEKLAQNHDAVAHVFDGHEALSHLTGRVSDAADHAGAGAADHFPVIGPALVIGMAAWLNYQSYRKGTVTVTEALHNVGERSVLAVCAAGAGWLVHVAAHSNIAALPATVSVRLLGGQVFHNKKRRELLTELVETVQHSTKQLEHERAWPQLKAVANQVYGR